MPLLPVPSGKMGCENERPRDTRVSCGKGSRELRRGFSQILFGSLALGALPQPCGLPIFAMVGPVLLVGAIAYGFSVRSIVVLDRSMAPQIASMKQEVAHIRELAGRSQ